MKKLLAFFLVVLSAIAFNRCNPYDTVIVTDVTVNPTALTLAPGESTTLVPAIEPDYAGNKNVTWASNDDAVATVDDEGKVTAHAAGNATITVTTEDCGHTATCAVTVTFSTLSFAVGGVEFFMEPVEGGTFQMGKPGSTHQVTLTDDYYMGRWEVTQGLWKAVMGNTVQDQRNLAYPSWPLQGEGDVYPMYYVSWNDICGEGGFLETLNTKLATELGGRRFALPTEAQWEFAARGGKRSNGYKYAGSDDIDEVAWYGSNSFSTTHEVGGLTYNELGLYDMSGNVSEWCFDRYGDYGTDAVTDPTGPTTGSNRVIRDGSWWGWSGACAVSSRSEGGPDERYDDLGFRLVLLHLPKDTHK